MPNIRRGMMAAAGAAGGGAGEYVGAPSTTNRETWFRADTVTLSGSDVTQWDDKSGNDNDVAAWGTANYPTLIDVDSNFGNLPTIQFGGGNGVGNEDDYKFRSSTSSGGTPYFRTMLTGSPTGTFANYGMFFVYRNDTDQSAYGYSQIIGDYYGYFWFGQSSASSVGIGNSTLTQTVVAGTPYASYVHRDGTNQYIETTGLDTVSSTMLGSARDLQALVGGNNGVSMYFKGQVAEIILYSSDLSSGDEETTKDYIANSYDLTW